MASDSDEIKENLIDDLRPRLCRLIAVQQVLDHLHIIGADQKERIRQKEATEGNLAAAGLLLDAVIKKPREEGWFQAFVDALEQSGCGHAADYIQVKLPEPEAEAENDYYVKLVHLMVPSLVDMKTETVCVHCASQDLITDADKEIVSGLCLPSQQVFVFSPRSLELRQVSLPAAATRWQQTRCIRLKRCASLSEQAAPHQPVLLCFCSRSTPQRSSRGASWEPDSS